ncbi:hypothetical protein RDWZM_005644 [Blomia tropicalis]|uniref:Glutamate--cysteine ligase n=1 Tax=Blomia tropicalis TaxID=40697 RepID=A0A9Q0M6H1_BLOTA|nr:hypothetical protein RDWZM_005644 [Blomia tropicalis]
MGLLTVGEPLDWPETKKYASHVRSHGIDQFLHIFRARRNRRDETLKWGDEIEYMVVKFDHGNRKVRLSLRASTELLKQLQAAEDAGAVDLDSLWRPEFAAYMIEGTPGQPYGILPNRMERALMAKAVKEEEQGENISEMDEDVFEELEDHNDTITTMFNFLNQVEDNMRKRREEVRKLLHSDESVLSISVFSRAGTYDFCFPTSFVETVDGYSRSLFFPDQAINHGHPRFRTLSKHICDRRGSPANIQLPIFRDKKTPVPFVENFFQSMNIEKDQLSSDQLRQFKNISDEREVKFRKTDHVYMDAMGFGMGCCCLQVTFQAANLCEARLLYDQLTPLCPILMALSAASPTFRGYITDVDCRWSVISEAVDDRTPSERLGIDPTNGDKVRKIPKSRYDSIDLYICPGNEIYNDIPVLVDEEYYQKLIDGQVDPLLARHIAHLFIRDPLVLFKEKLNIDDSTESDHFENIQSTNWQTMRFKPPPANAQEIGWRVEFRPMEVQLTDEDNAALVIFIVLLTRLILSFKLDLLIPMSKVEENMKVAQRRAAATKERFWFRKGIVLPNCVVKHFARSKSLCEQAIKLSEQISLSGGTKIEKTKEAMYDSCVQLTANEIINGGGDNFVGLIPLLNVYLDSMEIDAVTRCRLTRYLNLIADRARGNIPTPASLMRDFITNHPDYNHDSIVNDSIQYDMLVQIAALQEDKIKFTDLLDTVKNMKAKKN